MCVDFLSHFEDKSLPADQIHGKLKYMSMLQKVVNREARVIEIHTEDVDEYFK